MALLFRINVISKKLNRLCYALNQSWLPSTAYSRKYLFTNTCSIYFAKKKVDDLKIPKCPDFEQYFNKSKKDVINKKPPTKVDDEFMGKKDNEIRKSSIQPPMFDEPKMSISQKRTFDDKKNTSSEKSITDPKRLKVEQPTNTIKSHIAAVEPPINTDETLLTRQPKTPDKTKPTTNLPRTYDKKSSLDDFSEFVSPLRPSVKTAESLQSQTYKNKSQSKENETSIVDEPTKEQGSEPVTSTYHKNKKQNYIWLAAAGAALCGLGLAFWLKKSNSGDSSPSLEENVVLSDETKDEPIKGPLVVPTKVPYLIIGGGTACWSSYKAIIEQEPNAKVLVISNESHPPYKRPSLSKDAWLHSDKNSINNVNQEYFEKLNFYTDPMHLLNDANGGVSILFNRTAKYLKLCERKVVLDDGTEIEYEKCLLATGSKPRNLHIFQTAPIRIRNKISFFRNLNDLQSLKEIADKSESIAVIGGGFTASEISSTLTKYAASTKKLQVYQIFHEDGNMGMTLPRYLSNWVKKRLTDHGLFVIPNTQVDSVEIQNSKLKLELLNGKLIVVDHVIVALGTKPDVRFAEISGLKVINNCGIAVNENMEALPHLYVAGDAACLPGRLSKETDISYDYAIASGRIAGENMTGQKKPFIHQSMFWSRMAPDISFESVGLIDAALKTVGVFSNGSDLSTTIDDTNKGVIFYIKHDEVVGIVLWNIFNKINVARQVVAERKKLYDLNEVAKRFEIQE